MPSITPSDGAIVIFSSEGNTVTNNVFVLFFLFAFILHLDVDEVTNTHHLIFFFRLFFSRIIAQNSQLLGGINMVDYWPMGGSFAGTLVQGNTINAQNAFIKVGIPMGQMIWMTVPQTSPPRLFGGARIIGNRFISGPKGYFGFMIGISRYAFSTLLMKFSNSRAQH